MELERTAQPRSRAAPAAALLREWAPALRAAWRPAWTSRLLVWIVGMLAVLELPRAAGAARFDPGRVTAPFGALGDLLVAPGARWDAVWYLAIANDGYRDGARAAFFPLYPLLSGAIGRAIGSDVIAGILLSCACFVVALALLHRLCSIELGAPLAAPVLALVAFFPGALFFSAIYSESLFLALSVGTLLAARRGRWASAGVLGLLAAATRNSGVLLAVPIVLMFLYGPRGDLPAPGARAAAARGEGWRRLLPRHPPAPALAWVALVPCGLGAYLGLLALSGQDALAPFHAQDLWMREFAWPLGGVWEGARAAWDGLRTLSSAHSLGFRAAASTGDPLQAAGMNMLLFGFLIAAAVATIGALRRLPIAYGAYALVALALPLSYPVAAQPLMSLPRFIAVLFPLHMWAALWARDRGRDATGFLVACSAVLLGALTVQWATWTFVA